MGFWDAKKKYIFSIEKKWDLECEADAAKLL